MSKQISILGIGWLGLPLAKALIAQSHKVKGSTTRKEKLNSLENENIQGFQITLTEQGPNGDIVSFLEGSKILIINIPPGLRRNPEVIFVAKIRYLIPYIEKSDVQNVLFISSTSVFADAEGFPLISEKTAPNAISNAGKQLIEVEHILQNTTTFKTTILRFAGLFGTDRHPAHMLSRRSNIKNPKAPVNLIHLEDCIRIIKKIIKTKSWSETFNASYPDHPEKAAYYSTVCEQMGLPKPDYDFGTQSKGKIINAHKINKKLNYRFKMDLNFS